MIQEQRFTSSQTVLSVGTGAKYEEENADDDGGGYGVA